MPRPIVLAFSCCAALASLAAQAADHDVDTTLAGASATPGWVRTYVAGGGSSDERLVAAARAPDGAYVLASRRAGGAAGALIFLAKFRPDGSYDASFGGTAATGDAGTGRVLKDAWLSSVADMTVDAQGRIVVVGSTPGALGQSDYGVVRFNADGTDDTRFAGDGGTSVAFDYDAANNRVNDAAQRVATAPDGSVFVAGTVQFRASGGGAITALGVAKLKPDGSLDGSFGNTGTGLVAYCRTLCDNVLHVARIVHDAARNRILIGGDHEAGADNTDWFIVEDVPGSYSQQNTYAVDLGGASGIQLAYMTDLAVQADGKPVAAGWANDANLKSVPVLLRRNAEGVYEDLSFGNVGGRGMMTLPWTDSIVSGLAIDGLGRMLLAGEYAPFKAGIAARLVPSGHIDESFNGTASPSAYLAPTNSPSSHAYRTVFGRVFLDAGRPVIAGEATWSGSAETDYDLVLTRLQSDLIFADGFGH